MKIYSKKSVLCAVSIYVEHRSSLAVTSVHVLDFVVSRRIGDSTRVTSDDHCQPKQRIPGFGSVSFFA